MSRFYVEPDYWEGCYAEGDVINAWASPSAVSESATKVNRIFSEFGLSAATTDSAIAARGVRNVNMVPESQSDGTLSVAASFGVGVPVLSDGDAFINGTVISKMHTLSEEQSGVKLNARLLWDDELDAFEIWNDNQKIENNWVGQQSIDEQWQSKINQTGVWVNQTDSSTTWGDAPWPTR